MDAIVLQGSEAGGHRGTFLHAKGDALVGLISLISDVKPLCRVPLIAARRHHEPIRYESSASA